MICIFVLCVSELPLLQLQAEGLTGATVSMSGMHGIQEQDNSCHEASHAGKTSKWLELHSTYHSLYSPP